MIVILILILTILDIFGHIWCENKLDYTCYTNNIISEPNSDYHSLINFIRNKSIKKIQKDKPYLLDTNVPDFIFSQISNLISINKVIELF